MKANLLTTALIGAVLLLVGCSKSSSDRQIATSVSIPEEFSASQSFDPDRFLAGISIQPEGAILTSRELLHVSSFFQQTVARAQADGRKVVDLPRNTSVFKSLDASLKNTLGWSKIANGEKVDLAALAEFIEETQRH